MLLHYPFGPFGWPKTQYTTINTHTQKAYEGTANQNNMLLDPLCGRFGRPGPLCNFGFPVLVVLSLRILVNWPRQPRLDSPWHSKRSIQTIRIDFGIHTVHDNRERVKRPPAPYKRYCYF